MESATIQDRKIYRLFTSPEGKEVLDTLRALFYDRSAYRVGDPHHTSYQAGQQDVVGFILESIKTVEEEANETRRITDLARAGT